MSGVGSKSAIILGEEYDPVIYFKKIKNKSEK
jgi:hypothetical protein